MGDFEVFIFPDKLTNWQFVFEVRVFILNFCR